ncbi:MAG: spore germination protein [bacterium]|nr:spore germination protein [bacterium]
MVSKRQAILIVLIVLIATKFERLPSLISLTLMQDGIILLIVLGILDVLFLGFALNFFNEFNDRGDLYNLASESWGKGGAKVLYFILFCYLIVVAVLPFESVHDFFANNLFNELNYALFGLIFLITVVFFANKGLKTLGRTIEIFSLLIFISLAFILVIGLMTGDLTNILPLNNSSFSVFVSEFARDTLWFGSFWIMFLLTGKVKLQKNDKITLNLIIPYAVFCVFVIPGFYLGFYSIYNNLAGYQTNAISAITQFAFLNLDLGRVDWFLVLFEQVSTIISTAIYIYLAGVCFCRVFNIKKEQIVEFIIGLALFLLDVFVFKEINTSALNFREITHYFCIFVNYLLPFAIILTFKRKKQDKRSKAYV